jgi:hypothetical protein
MWRWVTHLSLCGTYCRIPPRQTRPEYRPPRGKTKRPPRHPATTKSPESRSRSETTPPNRCREPVGSALGESRARPRRRCRRTTIRRRVGSSRRPGGEDGAAVVVSLFGSRSDSRRRSRRCGTRRRVPNWCQSTSLTRTRFTPGISSRSTAWPRFSWAGPAKRRAGRPRLPP